MDKLIDVVDVHDLLPAQIKLIARLIGLHQALRLVEEYGGTTWPVAKGSTRAGEIRHAALADVIGEDAAEVLAQHYGGDQLYIPNCSQALRRARDLEINRRFVEGVRAGHSANVLVSELAREFKLSDRRVWDILKQTPPETRAAATRCDRTFDMFE